MSGQEKGQTLGIGLLGFGTVGCGVVKILLESKPSLSEKTGLEVRLRKIADVDLKRPRPVLVDASLLTTDALSVVRDPEVGLVVETIGGLEPARSLILEALALGKPVVTANKALLATHGRELFKAALENGASIGFEASVCSGVPVIMGLRDGLVANRIESVVGILNGTTNYLLTRMVEQEASYETALREAQARGYAEADPSADVDGWDAAHKLVLLADLGFHSVFNLKDVQVEGLRGLALEDVRFAVQMGYAIKLLAIAKRADAGGGKQGLELRVHPALIPQAHPLAGVRDVFNAVLVKGDAVGEVMFYGRGAGMLTAASAIVADILDSARGSARRTFTKLQFFQNPRRDLPVIPMGKVRSRYYARFEAADRPGVLGKLTTILGGHEVSIASVIQQEPSTPESVPVVILTHQTVEEQFRAALAEISRLNVVRQPPAFLRVED